MNWVESVINLYSPLVTAKTCMVPTATLRQCLLLRSYFILVNAILLSRVHAEAVAIICDIPAMQYF